MAENEECKICLASKADNTPMLNIITIDEYENLTGITLGPRKVKKIYVCKKCARDIKEAREIHNKIITSLEERKTRAQAECGNICALNSEPITDISRHEQSELIANLLRRELESDEQGKEFVCQNCFVKIDNANKTCKKIIESLKDFQCTPQKSATKSEAAGNTPSPKTQKQKELTNETKNNDLPSTTGTTPKTSKPKKATNVSVNNKSSPTTATRKISTNDDDSLEEIVQKVKKLNIKK
ncbi:uncharacterized protein LOC135958780 [Calliphora vicina]|uniref:uncharacterized protein LOC135958780 n=1 Tax=Calliphora vicina TaxID=7373 RepID=UPI00325A9481